MRNIVASLRELLTRVADKPAPMAALACQLLEEGHPERGRELATRALAMAPSDPEVMHLAATVLSHGLPNWHFKIVHDEARNAAYEGALRRAVRPGHRVLEIGTGTGILAMMAARAGAGQVVTCEGNAAVAEMASRIIAINGFADRVRVVAKLSADLRLGVDLEMDAEGSYENAPSPGARSPWAVQFFPLTRPIELAPGTEVIVHGVIERQSLRVWAEVPPTSR